MKRVQFRWFFGFAALVLALGATGLSPRSARANHFVGSTKTCTSTTTGVPVFVCILNIYINPAAVSGLDQGQTVTVTLTPATNAIFLGVERTGGSCPQTLLTRTGLTGLSTYTLTLTAFCSAGSTIQIMETLAPTNFNGGPVCQTIDTFGNSPPFTVCSQAGFAIPVGPPTDQDQCKNDGFLIFTNPVFKNQGDCVSFVATGGRNPANPRP